MRDTNPKLLQLLNSYNALKTRYNSSIRGGLSLRAQQIRNYDYAIGRMIKEDVRIELERDGRPIFEFQMASQMIEYIIGKLKRDMVKMKALPVSQGDEQSSALRTQIVNHQLGEKGYRGIAEAAVDCVIGKIGVVNNYWTKRDGDTEGKYICESVDPFLVMFDLESRQSDGSDERFVTYSPWHSSEEILEIYQKYLSNEQIEEIERNADSIEGTSKNKTRIKSWYERITGDVKYLYKSITGGIGFDDFVRRESGLYQVVEWHDKRTISKKVLYDPLTRDFEVLEDGKEQDNEYLQGIISQTKQTESGEIVGRFMNPTIIPKTVQLNYITSICPGLLQSDLLVEVPYEVQRKGFALKKIVFRRIHPDLAEAQSLMDRLIAPLDFYSQTKMESIQAVKKNIHPDIIYETGSITPANKEEWTSSKIGKLKSFEKGYEPPREEKAGEHVFQMLKIFSDEALDIIEQSGGIPLSARGYTQSANESGILSQTRIAQTEIMIADLFASVKGLTKEVWNFCNETLRKYMTTETMIRITNDEDNPEWIEINKRTIDGIKNDMSQGDFDFVPNTAATGETQKRENIAILAQLVPGAQADPLEAAYLRSIIYENLDIPDGKKLSKFVKQRIAQMQGIQQQGLETQQQNVQAQQVAQKMELMGKAKELVSSPKEKKSK